VPTEVFANFDAVPWRRPDGSLRGVITTGNVVTDMVLARREATARAAEVEQRYRKARADVAELQRALLPSHLPILPDAVVVAHYLVAAKEQAAGGDWFDCLVLPDRRLAVVVGDVVGHGLEASAAMAQLRAVLSELLVAGTELSAALQRVHEFAARFEPTRAATVCVALVDLATGGLTYASLGHPAPLIVTSEGDAHFLPPTGGVPLGTGGAPAELGRAVLAPDDVLVMFTDGLVERPGRPLHEGLDELARVAAAAASNRVLRAGAPRESAERVGALTVEVLTRTGYNDDVTVLAVQRRALRPGPFEYTVERADQLSAMRGAFGEWLSTLGVDPDEIGDLQLIATEAMSNSLEHAYVGTRSGVTQMCAELGPSGDLTCQVTDQGEWRGIGNSATNRGRGLSLIAHFADDLSVESEPEGTTVRFRRPVHRNAILAAEPPTFATLPPEPPFAAEVERLPEPSVRVRGTIDLTTAAAFAAAIRQAGHGGLRPVLVDLTEAAQLASAGVRVLFETSSAPGGIALLTRPGSSADAVIKLVGLDHLVTAPTDA
jgi:serine phosphatase RsbU (regulator of sigma subunit)/anti-sigma regulatory factor (Ser/Thr protein kinase)/anti-anti-sigma regulatory factor